MDMSLLRDVKTEEVEELPWDIDGNAIYKMKHEEDFWIESVPDGCWWKVVHSSRKDLKVKECCNMFGIFICNNPQCQKIYNREGEEHD